MSAPSAEKIAQALGGACKGSDGWWNAKCPAHEDGRASLALHDTDDGAVAFKCMAGCDSQAVGAALRARKLLPEKEAGKRPGRKASLGRIVATYDYVDERGERLFQVTRHEPKDFRQRRPDGKGGWIWKLDGVRRVLYRLPELVAADAAEPVFVVEGEKDVDRLRGLGLVATTNPQGAGKWVKADRGALAGRHVVVLPDNDQPGRQHAQEIARDLAGKAASVRILMLPNLPPKGDVCDWLDSGGTPDELQRLAAEEMPEVAPDAEPGNEDERWSELLHRTDRGEVRDVLHNAVIILRKDERFAGRLRWNQLLEAVEAERLPWRKGGWQEWKDEDDLQFANWCQQRHAYLKPRTVASAVQVVARDQLYHPVRVRLSTLTWDGTPRLGAWLTTYLGVPANAYTAAVGRAWMISAVARAYRPGCKVDTALILEGAQGAGKSQAAGLLALDQSLFTDQIADLGTKDSGQDLRGKWIIELAELAAMRRPEIERVKAFMSRREDHYRPSYGQRSQDYPRQCVFVGTTNSESYLADETGGRRFWPVKVGRIELEKLRCDREQLWAEAVVAYCKDERWWLSSEIEGAAREEQEARRIEDPWEAAIQAWLNDKSSATVAQVLEHAIGMPRERQDQRAQNRVAAFFKAAGWRRQQTREKGSRVRSYLRPEPGIDGAARVSEEPARVSDDIVVTENISISAAGTGVTGVTGLSATHARTCAHARPELSRHGCDTRDTRAGSSTETDSADVEAWAAQVESVPLEAEDGPAGGDTPPSKRVLFAAWQGRPQEATIVRDSALCDGAPKVSRVLLREIALGVEDGLRYARVQFDDPPKPGRRHDGAGNSFTTRQGRGRMAVLKGWPPIKLGTWPEIEQAVAARTGDVLLDCLGDAWP